MVGRDGLSLSWIAGHVEELAFGVEAVALVADADVALPVIDEGAIRPGLTRANDERFEADAVVGFFGR